MIIIYLGKENDLLVEDGEDMWDHLSQMPAMDMMLPPEGASGGERRTSSSLNLTDKYGLDNSHRKSPRSVGQVGKGQKTYRM
jgi:hypothetical protein